MSTISAVVIAVLGVLVIALIVANRIAVRYNKRHLAAIQLWDAAVKERDAQITDLLHWKDTHPYTEDEKEKLAEAKFRGVIAR